MSSMEKTVRILFLNFILLQLRDRNFGLVCSIRESRNVAKGGGIERRKEGERK